MIPFLPVCSLFLLLVVNPANANGHYDKILAHSRIRGRDQGPNVCALQQILGTKKKYLSTCRNWYQGAICGKKTHTCEKDTSQQKSSSI
uniref:Periostin n=1 Tax=Bos taurus TaxID=9913 RepID=J9QDM7_BOVIN|nr:periostin variant 2 [Bos taurus]